MNELTTLETRVIEIIADESDYKKEQVKLDHILQDDIPMDSLQIVEMIMRLEEEFDIEIGEEELESETSVSDIIALVKTKFEA